jgi:predicted deacylase
LQTRASLGKPPAILTQALHAENYLLAPESGVFEVAVDLGDRVSRGQPVGYIHHLERPDRDPEIIASSRDGFLITARVPCLTQQGDCVAVIGEEVAVESLL